MHSISYSQFAFRSIRKNFELTVDPSHPRKTKMNLQFWLYTTMDICGNLTHPSLVCYDFIWKTFMHSILTCV